ncbi:hypothetical protein ACO0LB_06505 [Undibacterium sp. SXout7W]|uniref:hypothetical protein n=1 Tax=Undibacterium sp. SXout7W TaxID=3413049 RepID=UPI003BEFC6E6
MQTAKIVHSPVEVSTRLAELGLKEELLLEALRQANLYCVRTTNHHPRLYRYIVMTAETIAALRDLLVPEGWQKLDEGHYELTLNPGGTVAIAVASGDDNVAHAERTPSNKSPKGRHTIAAVESNRQADMFADLLPVKEVGAEGARDTWVLLHRVTKDGIHSELSRPTEISDGMFALWSERILLGKIDLDGDPVQITAPDQPDIDIFISKKSA